MPVYSNTGYLGLWWDNLTGRNVLDNAAEGVTLEQWPSYDATLDAPTTDPVMTEQTYSNASWLSLYWDNLWGRSYADNAAEGAQAIGDAASSAGGAVSDAIGGLWNAVTSPLKSLGTIGTVLVLAAVLAGLWWALSRSESE